MATKLLKLRPNKITGTQQLLRLEREARQQNCRWFHELVTNGSSDLECMIFLGKAWFTLNGNTSSQNNRHWCLENPHAIYDVTLHDLKFRV
jgi:hypothetical protein